MLKLSFRLSAAASMLAIAGCAHTPATSPTAFTSAFKGTIFGGQQPISGATLQIYTAEQGTTGGTSTPLIQATLTSSDGTGVVNANANPGNANNTLPLGFFTIPAGSYTCSPSTTPVYFSASGGNSGSGVNPQTKMLAVVGTCASLGPATQLNVNEITTLAAVAALHSYMTAFDAIGSTAANYAAMTTAFTTTASEYANIATGSAPGPSLPSGYYASTSDLIALANSIGACVNSRGGAYSDGSPCGNLFLYTKPTSGAAPTDVVAALIDLLNNPSANGNVSNILGLASAQSPFGGASTSAPPDWSLPIYAIPGTPTISPNGGTYTTVQNVLLTDSDATATLYYTTDGSTPTALSNHYTGSFTVASTETIKAIAIESSRLSSSVASASFTLSGISAPAISLTSISTTTGSTTGVTLTASSNNNGSVVTFGTAGSIGGSFSPTTCTIAAGSCSVSYIPSGTLAAGIYTNDLTASFSAYGSYSAASASSTLTVTTPPYSFSLLASFTGGTGAVQGANPAYENLIQASDGNFYGTTFAGGANGYGTVFKITPGGSYTLLHTFSSSTVDGGYPSTGLVQGADGIFYGTTSQGGANGLGTVFKITSSGIFTLMHSFSTATTDGQYPYAGLIQGTDGNFYGTTAQGGAHGKGAVFKITTTSIFTLMYSFSFSISSTDGGTPEATLVQGTDGNFYGTTLNGGANGGYGTVFKMTPSGIVSVLYSFSSAAADGGDPNAALVQGPDGNFYGTTLQGGASFYYGTVFRITPGGAFTLLHSFSTAATDGQDPKSGLVLGTDGNFYGTTYNGGTLNLGVAYQITSAGTFTLLHSFSYVTTDGETPYSGLVQGADGSFYGATDVGGAANDGTIYKLTVSPALPGPVTLSVPSSVIAGAPFTFTYAVANAFSTAGVTAASNTTLQTCQYFATNSSGAQVATGALTGSTTATNATLTAPSAAGTYTYALTCGGTESGFATLNVVAGATPTTATVTAVTAPVGSTTGVTVTAAESGSSGVVTGGTVTFSVVSPATGTFSPAACTLSAAGSCTSTYTPTGSLAPGTYSAGIQASFAPINAYGAALATNTLTISPATPTVTVSAVTSGYQSTTGVTVTATETGSAGTASGSVVTFGVTNPATGSFSPATCTISNGSCTTTYIPSGTLAAGTYANDLTASFAAAGNYTTASATSTLTVVAYNFSLLASFTGTSGAFTGRDPFYGSLVQGSDGNFYGTTDQGGASGLGTVFKISLTGAFTLLHSFSDVSTDGANPLSSLVQGRDGNFYGTTSTGGSAGWGTIFEITPTGTYTTLHSFSGTADGQTPFGGLVQGSDGNFYGTTEYGGANLYYGTIFKITPAGVFTLLHSFSTATTDGNDARAGLVQGSDGNFYGTTNEGGTGYGTVFKMTPTGTFTLLHSFAGTSDGQSPSAALVQGNDGNFYGTTYYGGASNFGTIFKITSTGTFTLLHSFSTATNDGENPDGSLVLGSDGNFYGTTQYDGTNGTGKLFEITSTGTFTTPHSFSYASNDGMQPLAGMVQGSDGNLYGTTGGGGAYGDGTIFKLAITPALAAPVTLSVPASVTPGATFNLTYAVSNASSTAGVTATGNTTLQSCQYFATNSSGTQIATGALTAAVTATNATLTAPAIAGTYTYALTCGGTESGFATLVVH